MIHCGFTGRRRAAAKRRAIAWAAGLALLCAPAADAWAARQQTQPGWNTERALFLVAGARARRQQPLHDASLSSYRAAAEGYIYFFLDFEGAAEPVLLRSDQVAVELFWAQPGLARQVILGMRSQNHMPIRDFNYYLDRYTVIHDGFGDEIRVGHGHDVRSVVHPLAPDAETLYDYRLGDSTSIQLPGWTDPVRVYEIQVRPRDPGKPAFVGSLFIERARFDLVRLAFTFTPASYIDRRNQRVEIVLENGLWDGRYWLPREQRLLVRREMPELDLDMGTVIRTVVTITDYEFDPVLPPTFFVGPEIVFRGSLQRLAEYPFTDDLLAGLELAGVGQTGDPAELLALQPGSFTAEALGRHVLSGALPALRLYLPNLSAGLRFNRAEGWVTGAGVSGERGAQQLSFLGAYAWGARRAQLDLLLGPRPREARGLRAEVFLNRARDLEPGPAEAGLLNSLAAIFRGEDFRDPFFASGLAVQWRWGSAGSRRELGLSFERQRAAGLAHTAAPLNRDRLFRPAPRIQPGDLLTAAARLEAGLGPGRVPPFRAWSDIEAGIWTGKPFGRLQAGLDGRWLGQDRGATASLRIAAATGELGPQHLYYLGGRSTLPGQPFRGFAGDRLLLLEAQAWRELVPRYLRARMSAGAGRTWLAELRLEDTAFGGTDIAASRFQAFFGAGLAAVDGGLRLDLVLPLRGGRAGLLFSVDPRYWAVF